MTTLTRPLRVALYARVSTRDKDQDPELQLQPMREYAAARSWTVTEYVDHAPAADLAGRKDWARLLEDARRRRVDHILAWKLDRPFRSTLHCLRTLEEFAHRGVGFACLTREIDTTSPTGRLLVTILAAVAEFEPGLIAERVREGMTNARRTGVRLGRPPASSRSVSRPWSGSLRRHRSRPRQHQHRRGRMQGAVFRKGRRRPPGSCQRSGGARLPDPKGTLFGTLRVLLVVTGFWIS